MTSLRSRFLSSLLSIRALALLAPLAVSAQTTSYVSVAAAPLTTTNIGSYGIVGKLTAGTAQSTLTGAGNGLTGWDDALAFASRPATGDVRVSLRLLGLAGGANARAGLDLRNNVTMDAVNVGLVVSPAGSVTLTARKSTTATNTAVATAEAGALPLWLRLTRTGTNVTGAYSKNGSTWVDVGLVQLSLSSTVQAGVAVSSKSTSVLATAQFEPLAISTAAASTTPPATQPVVPTPTPTVTPPASTVSTDPTPYETRARAWDKAGLGARLGPSFVQLNPAAADTRPLLYKPVSKSRTSGAYPRTNPYELGSNPSTDGDYWSDSGQVGFLADAPATYAGLARIQTFAYYDKVHAISPRLDYASDKAPMNDPQTRNSTYIALNGGVALQQPIAMIRNAGMRQNEALVIYRDGLFSAASTQTARNDAEKQQFPGFKFPAHKVPTGIAITTANEFALVTIWDTIANKGQLAVVALEGKFLAFHTWPYMGLPNQGVWSAFKLLGYVDLPMTMPSSVSAASNGWWSGPSQTDNKVLSQIKLGVESDRKLLYDGNWSGIVARSGYAVVASRDENLVAVVDLSPLIKYVRESYLASAASLTATLAARGAGDTAFPEAFSVKPAITPVVAWQGTVEKPTAVLAGMRTDRWTKDYIKAHVACEDGTVHVINTSSLMAKDSWQRRGALGITGSFKVGRNPVALAFTRFAPGGLPLLPVNASGAQVAADPLNNTFWIACRGDREVQAAVTFEGKGEIYRRITDQRLDDPVALSVAERGPILTVADFSGKRIVSFRVATIRDSRNNVTYGCGATGTDQFEFAGSLNVPGFPYLVGSTNVN